MRRNWGLRPKRTILCIDDDEAALNSRRRMLESAGYRVLYARSGKQGLELLHSERVHTVLLDYWMPEQKGLEVARAIRRLKPQLPIIVLSGYASLGDEAIGLADDWFMKGDPAENLLSKIADLVRKAHK
jgi:CheY-like chemotaxis protein